MVNALLFVNSYLYFTSQVPAAGQGKVSHYKKELQAAEFIAKISNVLTQKLKNLTELRALVNEIEHLNQKKFQLATEIRKIITKKCEEILFWCRQPSQEGMTGTMERISSTNGSTRVR